MTKKTEKQFRDELADKYAPATIDLLIKAEREANRLADETDEDEDEGAELDQQAEKIAKARKTAADAIAKAEKIKTEVYTVSEPPADGNSEQRSAYEREPIPDNIDNITNEDVLRDIVKAVTNALKPSFATLAKATAKKIDQAVDSLSARLDGQDAIINQQLDASATLTKAVRKQGGKIDAIAKANDLTPAARRPKYSVEDVITDTQPRAPAGARSNVTTDELEGWITGEMERVQKAATDNGMTGTDRVRLQALTDALIELDAGAPLDSIAKAVGYRKA